MPLSKLLHLFRQANSRKGQIVRNLAQDSKRSFWAMADQGVVSLGNFGVSILLAGYFERRNDLADFGSYWILMELILFLNSVQSAVVIYPLSMRGPALDRQGLGRLASMSMLMTLMAWPIFGGVIVTTAVVAKIGLHAGLWAALALLLWQFQETLRRTLMAHTRFRAVIVGDAISYLGQVLLVAVLVWNRRLTLAETFQVVAFTSALGALLQAAQVGVCNMRMDEIRVFARECWSMGRWLAMSNLSNLFIGPLFNWNMAYWMGREMLGVYYAIGNLLRLTNPLSFAIATLIMPHAARARQEQGIYKAKHEMRRFGVLGGVMLLPYLGLLVIAPRACIAAMYGASSSYLDYWPVLQLMTVASALVYIAIVLGAFLDAVLRTRWTFVARLSYAVTIVLVAMPLTAGLGLFGAALGWMIAAAMQAAVDFYYVRKIPNEAAAGPAPTVRGEAGAGIAR